MMHYDAGLGEVRVVDLIGYQTSAKMSATGLTTAFARVPCDVADAPKADALIGLQSPTDDTTAFRKERLQIGSQSGSPALLRPPSR